MSVMSGASVYYVAVPWWYRLRRNFPVAHKWLRVFVPVARRWGLRAGWHSAWFYALSVDEDWGLARSQLTEFWRRRLKQVTPIFSQGGG